MAENCVAMVGWGWTGIPSAILYVVTVLAKLLQCNEHDDVAKSENIFLCEDGKRMGGGGRFCNATLS